MTNDNDFANGEPELHVSRRTRIEVHCKKPWSKLGATPICTITDTSSNKSAEHQLAWEASVFIALEPATHYRIRIRRPSDFLSFKAKFEFLMKEGEIKRLFYQSPMLSFLSGTITTESWDQGPN